MLSVQNHGIVALVGFQIFTINNCVNKSACCLLQWH